jgi:hypothetical protein
LEEVSLRSGFKRSLSRPFWVSLRGAIIPAGKLCSLKVDGLAADAISESDVEPLAQLSGSLEELVITCYSTCFPDGSPTGLPRFPESVLALTELTHLELNGHKRIAPIPRRGFSKPQKSSKSSTSPFCSHVVAPTKELRSQRTSGPGRCSTSPTLERSRGRAPPDGAFPAELKGMKSLRELSFEWCGLRRVPAFIGELKSLECLDLSWNLPLQIDALTFDLLLEGCPRLREVKLGQFR